MGGNSNISGDNSDLKILLGKNQLGPRCTKVLLVQDGQNLSLVDQLLKIIVLVNCP